MNIKAWLYLLLAIVTGGSIGYGRYQKAKRDAQTRKLLEEANEIADKAAQAIIDGNKRKEEARASNDSSGDHFTR